MSQSIRYFLVVPVLVGSLAADLALFWGLRQAAAWIAPPWVIPLPADALSDLALPGAHNVENALAALAATLPLGVGMESAVEALEGSGIPVAAVSTGFPAGLSPIQQRIEEIHASVAAGATIILLPPACPSSRPSSALRPPAAARHCRPPRVAGIAPFKRPLDFVASDHATNRNSP